MTLVQTREKLKPFVDDGVVHKDRKREIKRTGDEYHNQRKNAELQEKICEYRIRITEAIREKEIKVLERIITELTSELDETPDNNYIISSLKPNVIHAQICL